jgi:hypothetical protein
MFLVTQGQDQLKVSSESANTIDVCSQYYIFKTADEGSLFSEMLFAPTKVKDFYSIKSKYAFSEQLKPHLICAEVLCITFRTFSGWEL